METKYQEELEEKSELLTQIKKIEKKHGKMTLIYAAKDEEHNNAVVLLKLLDNRK
jgi:uncharacterized protein YeaO (DUF488 family)